MTLQLQQKVGGSSTVVADVLSLKLCHSHILELVCEPLDSDHGFHLHFIYNRHPYLGTGWTSGEKGTKVHLQRLVQRVQQPNARVVQTLNSVLVHWAKTNLGSIRGPVVLS